MADAVSTTFEILASSKNTNAVETLIAALDVADDTIRLAGVDALLKRQSQRGQIEIIKRLDSFPADVYERLRQESASFSKAIQHCIHSGKAELKANALELIRIVQAFDQVPTLVSILPSEPLESQPQLAETIRELVRDLYDRLHPESAEKPAASNERPLRNPQSTQQNILSSLAEGCGQVQELSAKDAIVEGVLALGHIGHFAVKKALWQGDTATRNLAADMLLTSTHPGIMDLVCESFSLNYPHPQAIEALSTRCDPTFVNRLLGWLPAKLTKMQQKNLHQIDSVRWLDTDQPYLSQVPETLHANMVRLIEELGLPESQKLSLCEWIVQNGGTNGRLAASELLAAVDTNSAQGIVSAGLVSEDANVQAWATTQLRQQGTPEAFSMLVERLDSPLEEVREAARAELGGFDVNRVISLYESLDPDKCQKAGQLLKKIDPQCVQKLSEEVRSPLRRKRMRAARVAQAMGLHHEIVDSLIEMSIDEDSHVRRTAVEILATITDDNAVKSLESALEDESPRVREAAARGLEIHREIVMNRSSMVEDETDSVNNVFTDETSLPSS